MGLAAVAATAAAVVLAATPASFVQAHGANGAFAEPGGTPDALLSSWAVLGLRAVGQPAPGSLAYLRSQEASLHSSTDVALVALAEEALGAKPAALLDRLRAATAATGQIGGALNATYWGVLALGSSTAATTRFILSRQAGSGGFAWAVGGQPDSNDTAAALEALRVAGVHGAPVARAVRFLRSFQGKDGGFELTRGRGSDAQSTAWAIQGLVAAGQQPPRSAFAYLAKLKRPDGSYRYSAQYVTTPVWVTSQVLAALAKKPFPLSAIS
ncbi:MAG TPA: prenyltransferase/squalene oxidase repeat-containing protein [Gaiellaceae bacterium]|nr:prenyltransferase/squalene oxidase repeat-containing protein [Gaiellaceae bacterium]